MTETVLVTGGAGFIGSHVCKALCLAGYVPVTYDNMTGGHLEAVRWGPLETGELADGPALLYAIRKWHPVAVIHLAGFIAAGESVEKPGKYYSNNLCGMLTLLDVMGDADVDRFVFSSSAAVYGDPETVPIREDAAIRPSNPYGHTKAMCEQMLNDHAPLGMRSISLRYFNAAGADPDGEIGEMHEPETHLIPLALDVAAGLRSHIDVYGTDYPTADGTCIRDYIHVSDLADAHVAALESTAARPGARAYNLGNGEGFSVLDVISTVEEVTGRHVPTRMAPRRPGDPPRLVADPARAIADLGWRQRHAALAEQVEHAWSWRNRQTRPPMPAAVAGYAHGLASH